ncbi:MAG: DUF805 domain-containing protein [Actinomycetia bacterium]|nr:DUF805 domain-containing protein [Actinomycetes bacterium]
MTFGAAVATCFGKYASFKGRARRSEFWFFLLFVVLLELAAWVLDQVFGLQRDWGEGAVTFPGVSTDFTAGAGWIGLVVSVLIFLPAISVSVRRLHDTDHSGWWWWLNLLNVFCALGAIILILAFYIRPGSAGQNRFGPPPN